MRIRSGARGKSRSSGCDVHWTPTGVHKTDLTDIRKERGYHPNTRKTGVCWGPGSGFGMTAGARPRLNERTRHRSCNDNLRGERAGNGASALFAWYDVSTKKEL